MKAMSFDMLFSIMPGYNDNLRLSIREVDQCKHSSSAILDSCVKNTEMMEARKNYTVCFSSGLNFFSRRTRKSGEEVAAAAAIDNADRAKLSKSSATSSASASSRASGKTDDSNAGMWLLIALSQLSISAGNRLLLISCGMIIST